jgi:ribonuclease-3
MVVATYLYDSMSDHPEGDLAKIKSVVVSEMTLSDIAVRIGVDKCLSLGKGEEHSGGRQKKAILADAVEAIFGAYYLDSGFQKVEKLILNLLVPEIEKVWENRHHKDFKTMLQEMYQKKYKQCPTYNLVKKTGPDHDMIFWVTVEVNGKVYGPEQGKSKKEAEQAVAKKVIEEIKDDF